jgi:benzoyl-CoA 2,3-dioxygenase component B
VTFNRKIGVFSEIETSPEGLILNRKLFEERKDEWLPSQDDGAFVASLMHAEVRPGYYAGWIAPPKMGIDNKAGDFEFVRIQ